MSNSQPIDVTEVAEKLKRLTEIDEQISVLSKERTEVLESLREQLPNLDKLRSQLEATLLATSFGLSKEESIDVLDLTLRTLNPLKENGILSVKDLADKTAGQLGIIRLLGKSGIREIREKLFKYGLKLSGD